MRGTTPATIEEAGPAALMVQLGSAVMVRDARLADAKCRVGQSGQSENALPRARNLIGRCSIPSQATERRPTRMR
jgi:hypothetical protein